MGYHGNSQDILETWRLRTPNEWEPLTVWSDVLTWRNAIYNVVINAFKHMGDIAPHLHQLGYKDKAWCGLPASLSSTSRSITLHYRVSLSAGEASPGWATRTKSGLW